MSEAFEIREAVRDLDQLLEIANPRGLQCECPRWCRSCVAQSCARTIRATLTSGAPASDGREGMESYLVIREFAHSLRDDLISACRKEFTESECQFVRNIVEDKLAALDRRATSGASLPGAADWEAEAILSHKPGVELYFASLRHSADAPPVGYQAEYAINCKGEQSFQAPTLAEAIHKAYQHIFEASPEGGGKPTPKISPEFDAFIADGGWVNIPKDKLYFGYAAFLAGQKQTEGGAT